MSSSQVEKVIISLTLTGKCHEIENGYNGFQVMDMNIL
jgi:hypothetical protein